MSFLKVIEYQFAITLPTWENKKLQQQLKSWFKRTINWNKYQSKLTREFAFLFENNGNRTRQTGFFLRKIEIKDYKAMTNWQNLFDRPVKNNQNIW